MSFLVVIRTVLNWNKIKQHFIALDLKPFYFIDSFGNIYKMKWLWQMNLLESYLTRGKHYHVKFLIPYLFAVVSFCVFFLFWVTIITSESNILRYKFHTIDGNFPFSCFYIKNHKYAKFWRCDRNWIEFIKSIGVSQKKQSQLDGRKFDEIRFGFEIGEEIEEISAHTM